MSNIEEYRTRLHSPNAWITRCISLFQSAEAVWKCGETSGFRPGSNVPRPESPLDMVQAFGFYKVAMMLYGLAVETGLKAILVQQKSDKIVVQMETDGGGVIRKVAIKTAGDSGGGHNLVELAKNAGLVSSNSQLDVEAKAHLEELTSYVSWRGRYPVPKALQASEEKEERISNMETIKFVRSFLRQHLKWPETDSTAG